MSYTTTELLKNHISQPLPVLKQQTDQQFQFSADSAIQFYNGAINPESITVKAIRQTEPVKLSVTITQESAQFSSSPVVPGSLCVGRDSSFTALLTENSDFIVNYDDGIILVKDSEQIPQGTILYLSFLPYHLYTESVDYYLNASVSSLQRIPGGNISTGETVLLTYAPLQLSFNNELLDFAVLEANGLIEKTIDPDSEFGADPVLQTAATYLALNIVCRSSSARELSGNLRDEKVAQTWLKLADEYQKQANELLAAFKTPPHNLSQPKLG